MNNLVSIIVPVYNVEAWLERCIQSILAQRYKSLEVILVDDGSPDGCPQICDRYANLDSRVKVIHKQNGGLSDARNAGMAIAKGEYIAFIDSDDWVSDSYVEIMHQMLEKYDADIVECSFVRTGEYEPMPGQTATASVLEMNTEEALSHLISDDILHQIVWNKLYKRSAIEGILFPKGKCNEDEFWTYHVFARASKVLKIDNILYYYFQNPGSIMGQGFKLNRLNAIEAKEERQSFINLHYPKLSDFAYTNLVASIIYAGQMSLLYLDSADLAEAKNMLNKAIISANCENTYHFTGKLKHRLWYMMAVRNLWLTCRLRNALKMNV